MKMFVVTRYEGKPAILDTKARVYYFGFRSMCAAQKRCDDLNNGDEKTSERIVAK